MPGSNSHTVAAYGGCTIIPLAAGAAQEDETILLDRVFKPYLQSVRPPGFARTIQVAANVKRISESTKG
jgi:hypothetical protein